LLQTRLKQDSCPAVSGIDPNTFPRRCVYPVVNAPLPTSTLLDRTTDRPQTETATERLARLFDRHQRRLFLLAVRLASDREEARDLVQETFLRAARSPREVPGGDSSGEAWLVRTLVNLCRDRWRRVAVRARGRDALRSAAEPAAPPEAAEEAAVARATVQAALTRLSPRRRAVIVLHELEGQAVREVARLLGVAEVTVRWHLLAARRELTRVLMDPRTAVRQGDEP
jgi:RNA polymerase sigma factor (sigma-70 family)